MYIAFLKTFLKSSQLKKETRIIEIIE